MSHIKLIDNFVVENFRNGELIWRVSVPNTMTLEGRNFILQTFFGQGITTLYVGLIDLVGYTAIANTNTAAQINGANGWKENVDYTNTTRQTYFAGTAASQSIDNSAAKASFTMAGAGTLKGAFVVSSPTKSGVAGRLVNAALFNGGDQAYILADVILVTAIYAD